MTSNSKITLNEAITAMESAYVRLSAAADAAVNERTEFAAKSEAAQAEVTNSWANHTAQLETQIAQLTAENEFLKQDTTRLSNQLQQLQADYLDLQATAGDVVSRLDGSVRQLDMMLESA